MVDRDALWALEPPDARRQTPARQGKGRRGGVQRQDPRRPALPGQPASAACCLKKACQHCQGTVSSVHSCGQKCSSTSGHSPHFWLQMYFAAFSSARACCASVSIFLPHERPRDAAVGCGQYAVWRINGKRGARYRNRKAGNGYGMFPAFQGESEGGYYLRLFFMTLKRSVLSRALPSFLLPGPWLQIRVSTAVWFVDVQPPCTRSPASLNVP